MATRQRPSAPTDGSRTITLQESHPGEEGGAADGPSELGTLHLRGAARARPRVAWREDVVDNEGAGKKSSKICCIYHKPKPFDESSSESESSESDSDCDRAHPTHNHSHRRRRPQPHQPAPGGDSSGNRSGEGTATRGGGSSTVVHELAESSDEANMYERAPGRKQKGKMPARH